jgi:hypothetical protein
LSFMANADASISKCQFNISFRYRSFCDSWHNATARRHLSEQNGLVRPASINCDSHCWDGQGGRGRQQSGAASRCSCRFAVGHAAQSNQHGVASTYVVFDMPTICYRQVTCMPTQRRSGFTSDFVAGEVARGSDLLCGALTTGRQGPRRCLRSET